MASPVDLADWLWILWWGGLTFYAAIVVPLGTDLHGSLGQGFVTQRVTNWLNALLAAALIVSLPRTFRMARSSAPSRADGSRAWWTPPRRWLIAWGVLVVTLIFLCWWHTWLDALLDRGHRQVRERELFYARHRVYLWLTAVQWLAGLVCVHESRRLPSGQVRQ